MRWSMAWLGLSGLLFALYSAYAVWGAFQKAIGTPPPVHLSEVGEFLLFLASIIAFTVYVIIAERARPRAVASEVVRQEDPA